MYVCICREVQEREVRAAIAGGAHDVRAVGSACGAGTDCGGCHNRINDMIDEIVPAFAPSGRPLLPLIPAFA